MARKKDMDWNCGPDNNTTIDQAQLAVLMDIRDELKDVNSKLAVLQCPNFQAIPRHLDRIRLNTSRRRRRNTGGKRHGRR